MAPPEATADGVDWRDQPVIVNGMRWRLGWFFGGRLYHGSCAALAVGDVVEPGHGRNFDASPDSVVSITSDPARALYWAREAGAGVPTVYEVEPLGEVGVWRASPAHLWEGRVRAARVVAVVAEVVSAERGAIDWSRTHPTRWCATDGGPPPWVRSSP